MQYRMLFSGLSVVTLVGALAAAQGQGQGKTTGTPQGQTPPRSGSAPGQGSRPTPSSSARSQGVPANVSSFMKEAAQGGIAEVQLAALAAQKATSEEVKALARQIGSDHQQANQELQQLASAKSVTLPSEPGASQKAAYSRLEKLTGQNFDQAYVDEMVKDHRTDIATFKAHANVSDHEIAAFVTKTLPVLQAHLSHAEAAQTSVKGASKSKEGASSTAPKAGTSSAPRSGASPTPAQKGR